MSCDISLSALIEKNKDILYMHQILYLSNQNAILSYHKTLRQCPVFTISKLLFQNINFYRSVTQFLLMHISDMLFLLTQSSP